MYGWANTFASDNNLVRNEISFQNLIAVASNPELFSALDEETKSNLIKIIAAYTKESISQIMNYPADNDREMVTRVRRNG